MPENSCIETWQNRKKRKHTAICRKNEHWGKWVRFPVGQWEIIGSNVLETREKQDIEGGRW